MFWRKKDHSLAIEKIVVELISNGHKTAVLPWLSIKDAIHYAYTRQEHPIIANNSTMVQCNATINDILYILCFQSHPDKGVYFTPTKYFGDKEFDEDEFEEFEEFEE